MYLRKQHLLHCRFFRQNQKNFKRVQDNTVQIVKHTIKSKKKKKNDQHGKEVKIKIHLYVVVVGTICFSISATNCNQYVSRSTSRYLLFIGLGFRKTAKIFLENVGIGSR